MQCPLCGTINPAQARFCMGCGKNLINGVVCGTCHALLPPQARYCYHCGAYIAQAGDAPDYQAQQAQPAAFTPPAAVPHPKSVISPPGMSAVPAIPVVAAPLQPAAPPPTAAVSSASISERAEVLPSAAPERLLGQLPTAQPLEKLLPSLSRYLPKDLYEPLERRPKERDLAAVCGHLAALIGAVKTYLPWPVVLAPQPPGEPAGGMYRGVFVFADVSGFTPLSEKLKALGQVGAEKITSIINSLFTELVSVLFAHGGTLLKFGGDAMLGNWQASTDEEMAEAAFRAAQTGMAIQEVLKKEQFASIDAMGEKYTLRIKVGLSAGPFFAAHIGTLPSEVNLNGTMAYVTTGATVNQAEEAQGHANAGDVTMTKYVADLLGAQAKVAPVNVEPDEGYQLLVEVPPLASGQRLNLDIPEPPAGEVMAQITYLVERLNRLTPYLSDELVSRIVTNPKDAKITPEHRPVTVMFANYKGISRLIEKHGNSDPRLITEHLNKYFVHMASIVEKYEGTLARMDQYAVGDRIVIFFGAPRAHEDDPVRAVYTALEMQEAVREKFAALRTSTGVYRFEQRIGINTGHLFAGNAGAPDLRQEYTLMGDDINMAARLMSKAGWGEIFISRKTKDHVEAFIEVEDRGEFKLKGKEIKVQIFTALGRRSEVGQTRGLEHRESPLTGREQVLEKFKDCGRIFLNRRGQIVSLVGNSGLGKSRLLREFKSWLAAESQDPGLLWIESRALSFSEQMSYWMASQMMRGLLKISANANQDDVLYALGQRGDELLGENAMDAIPYLAHMMGLELGEEWAWVKKEDPKVRQKQTLWAMTEFLSAFAKQQSVVIALDDLHWADEASLTLFEHILRVTDKAGVMFILIFRGLRDKGCWKLRDRAASEYPHRYTEFELEPLNRELSAELLEGLLPGAQFTSEVRNDILDKSAGNPFYLEEVVRSLIEGQAVVRDAAREGQWNTTNKISQITVPATLHAAIVARIDRLTEDARLALQMASVIGRQFRLDLLRNLSKAEAEIDLWLAQLERGGLLQPAGVSRDPVYSFPDALVQEVAYDSVLVFNRQQLHRQIGGLLEIVYADNIEQNCELLAYHFSRSDDREKALKYLQMAAKSAEDKYANATAIQNYAKILTIQREQGDKTGQAATLYSMGLKAYEIGDYENARPWLEESVALLKELQDVKSLGWSVMYLGMVDLKQANYTLARQHHQFALDKARERGDRFQEGIHLTNVARVTMRMGQYEHALQQFAESQEIKKGNKDIMGQGFALFYLGLTSIYQGSYDKAEGYLNESVAMWQQVTASMVDQSTGRDAHGASTLNRQQIMLNERGLAFCEQGLGLLALGRGLGEQAVEHFQKAVQLCEKLVLKAELIENLSHLSQARLRLGDLSGAHEVSLRAINRLQVQKDVEEVQQIYLNHHRVLATMKSPEARDYLEKAAALVNEQAARIEDLAEREIYLQRVRVNQEIRASTS